MIKQAIRPTITGNFKPSILGSIIASAFTPEELFKNGEQGVWYDPTDLATMYQEHTGGSPVTANGDAVGLMLDKSRGELLGDELVTNGTFDNATGWALGTGWSISGGVASCNGTQTGNSGINQILPIEIGKTYLIAFDLVVSAGFITWVALGGDIDGTNIVSSGSYSATITPTTTEALSLAGAVGFVGNVDNISVKEVLGIPAQQPVSTQRPTYNDNPDRLTLDLVDDSLAFTVPTGGIDGYMVVGTDDGTASYGVSLPAGDYGIGGDYFMGGSVNGFLLREGDVSDSDLKKVEAEFVKNGAKASYGDVTNFTFFWRGKNITEFPLIDTSSGTSFAAAWRDNNLTSFPLLDVSSGTNFGYAWFGNSLTSFPLLDVSNGIDFSGAWYSNNLTSFPLLDVSSGTNFGYAWYGNNLTSFPLLDTSSGTNFSAAWRNNNLTSFPLLDVSSGTNFGYAWYGCSSLTSFPANMFDSCLATNFANAFSNTNLSEQSIDNILVSINSNGTSNGTFNQSGGSAPSSTGESAITALRSRGWTVTVTGGY